MPDPNLMRLVYAANVVVAGTVGGLSLFAPALAATTVFSSTSPPTGAMRIVGCLWLAIAALSAAGLRFPVPLGPVLLIQLLYKGLWLLAVALPAVVSGRTDEVPWGIAAFFAVWVVVLPFVIPFRALFGAPAHT